MSDFMQTGTIDISERVNGSVHFREGIEKEAQEKEKENRILRTLLDQPLDDNGNATCVFERYSVAHNESVGWMFYNGTHWSTDGAGAAISQAIVETLQARVMAAWQHEDQERQNAVQGFCKPNRGKVQGCEYLLQSMAYVSLSEFDNSPDLLNCANGVVDLRTGEIEPHGPEQKNTYCSPVAYKPTADYADWEEWLLDAVGDQKIVEWLQMAVGYSMTGCTYEDILFYIFGPTRSGKGLFTETISSVLGHPLAQGVNFSTFTEKRSADNQNFDLAPLKAARMVSASESNAYERFNEAKVKALTGNNQVSCAFKHKTHFNYYPQYKIWLSSNHPVNADPDDDAVWARIRVIEFPTSHLGKENKSLRSKMRAPAYLEGVLAWAVEGAIKWYELGSKGLVELESSRKSKQEQRDEQDNVQAWLDECCKIDAGSFAANSKLYPAYRLWCEVNGVEAKKKKSLTLSLKKKGYEPHHNGSERGIKGFSITG